MKFLLNTLISALVIAGATELGKRSTYVAALLVALPLTSILALSFAYVETKDTAKVVALSQGIFWLVLPTLLFFLLLPLLLKSGLNFWAALISSMTFMAMAFLGYSWLLKKFGIEI